MPNVITEGRHAGEFLISEANGYLSREKLLLLADQVVKPGHVLGHTLVGAVAAATAFAANTGNGAMGAITVSGQALRGRYRLVVIEPATNAGMFVIEDPKGNLITTTGDVAAAFSAMGLAFTLADNTDFAAGDGFYIDVTGGAYKYKIYDPDNTDGSQIPRAIAYDHVDATGADKYFTAIKRLAEVNAHALEWFDGATDNEKAAALEILADGPAIVGRS